MTGKLKMEEILASATRKPHKIIQPFKLPAWLDDLENEREGLFEALFSLIDDDKIWCDKFIKKAQGEPDKLVELCVSSHDEVCWKLPPEIKHYEEHLEAHKKSCLRHIAFLELALYDLQVLYPFNIEPLPDAAEKLVILPTDMGNDGVIWVMRSFVQAAEHLAGVRMLVNKDRYLSQRRKGGQKKARRLEENDLYNLLRPLVKILLQSKEKRKRSHSRQELLERFVSSIMELWKVWPFFHLDRNTLTAQVETILIELNVMEERQKNLFERRRPAPMSRPQHFSRATELEFMLNEAWQEGVATALMYMLKTNFDGVDEDVEAKIKAASPEQLSIWLCRTRKAMSLSDVLD